MTLNPLGLLDHDALRLTLEFSKHGAGELVIPSGRGRLSLRLRLDRPREPPERIRRLPLELLELVGVCGLDDVPDGEVIGLCEGANHVAGRVQDQVLGEGLQVGGGELWHVKWSGFMESNHGL